MSGHTVSRDSECRPPGSWPELYTEIGPVEKVFNTVELCEQILEYLPCADLNRARRVYRQFNAVISQSTLMRQRSSLRLASDQILWATPDDTLLTGIYAEDHIAAKKAKGLPTDAFAVYELHPYLKVVHHDEYDLPFSHKMAMVDDSTDWTYCGFHEVTVGDFCLLNFPDHFPLDDEYISRPPVKEINVYLRRKYDGNLKVRNSHGIKFKDLRAAVKSYLIKDAYATGWEPCSDRAAFVERMANIFQPHGQQWIIQSDPSMINNCKPIFFDCVCFCIVIAFSLEVYISSTIDVLDIVILPLILAFLQYYARFHITSILTMATVLPERHPNEIRGCTHSLYLEDSVPITTEEKLTLEKIGIITETNDPYCKKRGA